MPAPHKPPPLTDTDTLRILTQLRPLLSGRAVVVIGGSAVSLWNVVLRSGREPDVLATRDLDFLGDHPEVRTAARILDGDYRLLTPTRHHTAQTGAVTFLASDGYHRTADFLQEPYGLTAAEVIERAVPLDLPVPDQEPLRIWVMHPFDCLQSRVPNNALLDRPIEHAHAQVQAAIELLPLYGWQALDDSSRQRDIMRINEQVYRLALDQSNTAGYQAMRLYLENGIDIERAVLHDRRLPAVHLETRLPQLSHQLAQHRTEALKWWRQNAGLVTYSWVFHRPVVPP